MPKNRHTIPPTRRLRLQKVQRGRRKQDGVYKTTYLAKVDGRVKVQGAGLFWVHDPAGTDNNGNTIYGAARKMPMLSGAVIDPRPNLKVDVVTVRGVDYIARMNKTELDRMGYDAHQTNILDPQRKYIPIEHLTNFQAFSTPGVATVQVTGSIFRKSDGTYGIFPTTGGYDLITGNTPSTDMQVVICQWFDTDAEDVVVTVSSEISRDIDLTAPANIATRIGLINECAALAPANSLGITAWQIYDTTTSITNKNKLDDLRGIVGTGHGSLDDLTDVIITSPAAYDLLRYNGSAWVNVKNNVTTTDPTITDDSTQGYAVWSRWLNTNTDIEWICSDATASAAVWVESVSRLGTQTLANKAISASANTLIIGAGVSKTLSGDVLSAGTDRHIVVSAESGTTDVLREITGLSVGESIYLRAASGHTIAVQHNHASATIKIHLQGDTSRGLDEQIPLKLTLMDTNILSQDLAGNFGDVFGLGTTTTNALVRWSNVFGTNIKDSNAILTDNGALALDLDADVVGFGVRQHSTQTANPLEIRDSGLNLQHALTAHGGTIHNEEGNDVDFRVESDNDANALFVDGGNDNVGFGTGTPDASAKVDIVSTTKGFGLPSMTTAQRTAIPTPRDGLVVYDSDFDALFLRANGAWTQVGSGGANTALSNLASVAINTSLISDTDSTDDLGSPSVYWANGYIDTLYLSEQSAPSTPASGHYAVYPKSDGLLYGLNDGATEHRLSHVVVSANKVHKFGANQSTSSNTMVDVDATNAAITATLTGGGKCRVACAFRAIKNTAGSGFFRLTDGTNSSNEVEVIQAASPELMVIHWVFDTSAGSTTYKLQYRSDNANTITLQAGIAVGMTLLEVA